MKKKKRKEVISVLLMLLTLLGICVFAFRYNSAGVQRKNIQGLTKYEEITYSNYSNIDSKIIDFLNKLPYDIKDKLNADNWAIIILDENETMPNNMTQYIPSGDGYTLTGSTTILSRTIIVKNSNNIEHVLAHEIGHALSYEYGYLSFSFTFSSLFQKYAADYNTDEYFRENRDEFFAEMFAEYITNEEGLKEKAPDLHEFFEEELQKKTVNSDLIRCVYMSPIGVFRMLVAQIDKINQVRI